MSLHHGTAAQRFASLDDTYLSAAISISSLERRAVWWWWRFYSGFTDIIVSFDFSSMLRQSTCLPCLNCLVRGTLFTSSIINVWTYWAPTSSFIFIESSRAPELECRHAVSEVGRQQIEYATNSLELWLGPLVLNVFGSSWSLSYNIPLLMFHYYCQELGRRK